MNTKGKNGRQCASPDAESNTEERGAYFLKILHTMFPYILGLQCQNWDCDNLINFFFTCTILNSLSLSFQIFTSVMQYKPEERLQIRVIFIQNCKTLYKENGLVK